MESDVIVVGGGVTGLGVARDCALRGLSVIVVEQGDICRGATGRNHGLLHSGARYAVTDPQSAAECVSENAILRRVAPHCIDECDGLFINLPGDDEQYRSRLMEACRKVGINAREIDGREALSIEPKLNPEVTAALIVPDAAIDPFALSIANAIDAHRHGATLLLRHRVDRLIVNGARVTGVAATNLADGTAIEIHAAMTVVAAGIWGQDLLASAGVALPMLASQGTMLVYGTRPCRHVINRCRVPSDADLLVPDRRVSIMGTTSVRVEENEHIEAPIPTADEVRAITAGAALLVPELATTRVLRAYAGIRPLVATDGDATGRNLSRGIVCIDHDKRDGLDGLVTITGGKLATYRLMAEQATDLVCGKLGINAECVTAERPLPGSDRPATDEMRPPNATERMAISRHGAMARDIYMRGAQSGALVCECMSVTRAEVEFAINVLGATDLSSLRQCTRLGMGQCQGRVCACRAANLLVELGCKTPEAALQDLKLFTGERWRGQQVVAYGTSMREAARARHTLLGLCGLQRANDNLSQRE